MHGLAGRPAAVSGPVRGNPTGPAAAGMVSRRDARTFLEERPATGRMPKTIPVLEHDRGTGQGDLRPEPMGGEVVRVSYPPHGLRIELQYREPVASIIVPAEPRVPSGSDRPSSCRRSDVDLDRLKQPGRLVRDRRETVWPLPWILEPGATWKPKAGIADITSEGNRRIPVGRQTGGFPGEEDAGDRAIPARRPGDRLINPMDRSAADCSCGTARRPGSCGGMPPGRRRREISTPRRNGPCCRALERADQEPSPPDEAITGSSRQGGLVHHARRIAVATGRRIADQMLRSSAPRDRDNN